MPDIFLGGTQRGQGKARSCWVAPARTGSVLWGTVLELLQIRQVASVGEAAGSHRMEEDGSSTSGPRPCPVGSCAGPGERWAPLCFPGISGLSEGTKVHAFVLTCTQLVYGGYLASGPGRMKEEQSSSCYILIPPHNTSNRLLPFPRPESSG